MQIPYTSLFPYTTLFRSPAGRQSSRRAHWAQRRRTWSMLMAALAAGIAITPFSRRQSIARPGAIRLGIDAENLHFDPSKRKEVLTGLVSGMIMIRVCFLSPVNIKSPSNDFHLLSPLPQTGRFGVRSFMRSGNYIWLRCSSGQKQKRGFAGQARQRGGIGRRL